MPHDLKAIQCGFEESAPFIKNNLTGKWHGINGKGTSHSFCLTRRLRDQQFGSNGQDKIIMSNDKNGIYAWNKVRITPAVLAKLKSINAKKLKAKDENLKYVQDILRKLPKNAIKEYDYNSRNERIKKYRIKNGFAKL